MEAAYPDYTNSSSLVHEAGSSAVERQSAGCWALLPGEILHAVLDRLATEVCDYVRFAAVCKDWLSAALNHQAMSRRRHIFPELLIPTEDKSETHRGWYNAVENRILNSRLRVPYNKRCCGSSHGWLIFPDETLALTLFNPFSGATIHLPPVSSISTQKERERGHLYHEYEIEKVVLSADPSSAPDSYEALSIFGDGSIGFFKSRWSAWVHVMRHARIEDATYFDGKFYVGHLSLVARLDASGDGDIVTPKVVITRPSHIGVHRTYLVRTPCKRLLWVHRFYVYRRIGISIDERDNITSYFEMADQIYDQEEALCDYSGIDAGIREKGAMNYHRTSRFIVYEVKEVQGKTELAELKTLDGQILFLGHNDSECISGRDFPEYRANCIYYMDDCLHLPIGAPYYPLGAIDIGVFDLDTQCCKQLDVAGPGKGYMPPPIWMLPPKPKLGV